MKAVVQRVARASVDIDGSTIARIEGGLLVLVAVRRGDGEEEARRLAGKIAGLRIFSDGDGRMNLSIREAGGEVLVVSQFTLYGDVRKGNRPSFVDAAEGSQAEALLGVFASALRDGGLTVFEGRFGANMQVALVNDGPVTIIVEL